MPIALACVLLGILIPLQFRTQRTEGFPLYNQRADLLRIVRDMETARNKLEAELAQKEKQISTYEQAASKGESLLNAMRDQLEFARMEAGLTPLKGPGLTIRLIDSLRTPGQNDDPYLFIVHDVDLEALVNELFASGAEAISINEQRIVATTSIRCVGPTVLVNSVPLASPYVVKAIGQPATLEGGLRTPGGFLDSMMASMREGVQIKIARMQEVAVPGYRGGLVFRYAKMVKEGER